MSVISQKVGQLEYLTAEGITAPHCFTTRLGGVSQGHLESLNLSTSQGDTQENVVENFRRVGAVLGFSPEDVVRAKQTHSDIVRLVTRQDRGAGLLTPALPECDALITNEPGVALYISTADCTPILLHDPVTGAVGAAHAGWRGTVAQIGAKTVEAMCRSFGCEPRNIRAAIGPNIGLCHFETDGDVPQAVREAFGPEAEAFIRPAGEKFYLDLKAVNALSLRRAGIENMDISTECTVCQSHRFWSHRVTRGIRGAQGAIILCKEGTV